MPSEKYVPCDGTVQHLRRLFSNNMGSRNCELADVSAFLYGTVLNAHNVRHLTPAETLKAVRDAMRDLNKAVTLLREEVNGITS
jgi:hypothetical protein